MKIVGIAFLFLIFLIGIVSASCAVVVTMNDGKGSIVSGNVYARCENAGKERSLGLSGLGVVQSFGGPFDSCADYCGNLWIEVRKGNLVEKAPYYPMNESNQENWNNTKIRYFIDLLFDGKTTSDDILTSYISGSKDRPTPRGRMKEEKSGRYGGGSSGFGGRGSLGINSDKKRGGLNDPESNLLRKKDDGLNDKKDENVSGVGSRGFSFAIFALLAGVIVFSVILVRRRFGISKKRGEMNGEL